MKRISLLIILLIFTVSCSSGLSKKSSDFNQSYHVTYNKNNDDMFYVTVSVNGLKENDNIYNFAATAPGTYRNLNFGEFVKTFKAYDENGNEIKTDKISTNRYQFEMPTKVRKIEYIIDDTFESSPIFPMGGTSISDNYIFINTFGILGYFENRQSESSTLKVKIPEGWEIGTALNKKSSNVFIANSYDHLADSPLLLGKLSTAKFNVEGIDVELFVYSTTNQLNADSILEASKNVLVSARKFMGFNAAPRYSFLMVYLGQSDMTGAKFRGFGALEHKLSSAYVLPEGMQMQRITDIMAHEFFHVITPLNIHSEVIAKYNFAKPTASEHLWLYEGVTEWASDIMQLRNGLFGMEDFLQKISTKMQNNDRYDKNYSLSKMSLESFTPKGGSQFGNIYEKGSLVATLLDIRLLELSNGKKGLRELLIELSKKYGKDRAFDDKTFFDEFVKMTYPQIRDFIDNYIRGTKELPMKEYFAKMGYEYIKERPSKNPAPQIDVSFGVKDGQFLQAASVGDRQKLIKTGDVFLELEGEAITLSNARQMIGKICTKKVGETINIKIKRGDEELTFDVALLQRMDSHVYVEKENPSQSELKFRNTWLYKN